MARRNNDAGCLTAMVVGGAILVVLANVENPENLLGVLALGVLVYAFFRMMPKYKDAEDEPRISVTPTRRSRHISNATKMRLAARDGYHCRHCGTTEGTLHVDHVVPFSLGGTNDLDNLQLLCSRCNIRKSNRFIG